MVAKLSTMGGTRDFENDFKLGILLTIVDLFDEVVENTDDQLLLLGTWELLELGGLHHEATEDWGNVLLGEAVVDVFGLELLDGSDEALCIDLSSELL
jgi:hypothetical protein